MITQIAIPRMRKTRPHPYSLPIYIVTRYTFKVIDTASPPVDYAALANFRFAIRGFFAFTERAARSVGLDPQQYQLMLVIKARDGGEGLTIGEAAERMLLRHHTMVELVDRAIRNGLVSRARDTADRRIVRLRLTADGETVLGELSAHHLGELQTVGPRLVDALSSVTRMGSPAGASRS